jgi:hypothetical protein
MSVDDLPVFGLMNKITANDLLIDVSASGELIRVFYVM